MKKKQKYYSYSDNIVQELEHAVALVEKVYRKDGRMEAKTYQKLCDHILEALNGYLVYRLPHARLENDPRVKVVEQMQMNALAMPEVMSGPIVRSLGGGDEEK